MTSEASLKSESIEVRGRTLLPGWRRESLHARDEELLRELFSIAQTEDGLEIRPRRSTVGAAVVRGQLLHVAPPVSPPAFAAWVAVAYGIEEILRNAPLIPYEAQARTRSPYEAVLAALLVRSAEHCVHRHIIQDYTPRTERIAVVRGRPSWLADGARPADGRVTCTYHLKETNVLANQLVASGVRAAERWLRGGALARRARTQRFIWDSLAETVWPRQHDFDRALSALDRRTEHYRPALQMSRALLLGMREAATRVTTPVPGLIFDVAYLFERLASRVVEELVLHHPAAAGWRVELQHARRDAFVDADGRNYRGVRPDIVLLGPGQSVGVFDAKYKPQYLRGGPGRPAPANRATLGDLYQMCFYVERLQRVAGRPLKASAVIIAPGFDAAAQPERAARIVEWSDASGHDTVRIEIVPLPVVQAVEHLTTRNVVELRRVAPELAAAVDQVLRSSSP